VFRLHAYINAGKRKKKSKAGSRQGIHHIAYNNKFNDV
jgi:hypothetical protein